jgi:hypothetical protein
MKFCIDSAARAISPKNEEVSERPSRLASAAERCTRRRREEATLETATLTLFASTVGLAVMRPRPRLAPSVVEDLRAWSGGRTGTPRQDESIVDSLIGRAAEGGGGMLGGRVEMGEAG